MINNLYIFLQIEPLPTMEELRQATINPIIPIWIIVIVVIKEFLMVSGASFLYGKNIVVSKTFGVENTLFKFVVLAQISQFVLVMFIAQQRNS